VNNFAVADDSEMMIIVTMEMIVLAVIFDDADNYDVNVYDNADCDKAEIFGMVQIIVTL
jgi:hypothetical protein